MSCGRSRREADTPRVPDRWYSAIARGMRASAADVQACEAVRKGLEKSGLRIDSRLHKLGYQRRVASPTSEVVAFNPDG